MDQNQTNNVPEVASNQNVNPAPVAQRPNQVDHSSSASVRSFERIRHATAWVMIVSAVLFASIGILAIWEVFGSNAGDVIWRALSSLAVISFAALIVNVAARAVESRR